MLRVLTSANRIFDLLDEQAESKSENGTVRRIEGNIKFVMWNSGPDFSALGESDDPDYGRHFICVEGGTLYRDRAYTLAPGASHTLKTIVAVRPID